MFALRVSPLLVELVSLGKLEKCSPPRRFREPKTMKHAEGGGSGLSTSGACARVGRQAGERLA